MSKTRSQIRDMILEELGIRNRKDRLYGKQRKLSLLELLDDPGFEDEDVGSVVGDDDDQGMEEPFIDPSIDPLDPVGSPSAFEDVPSDIVGGEYAEPYPEEFMQTVDPMAGEVTVPVDSNAVSSLSAGVAQDLGFEASNPSGGDAQKAGLLGQLVGIVDSIKSKFGGSGNATEADLASLETITNSPEFANLSQETQSNVINVLNSAQMPIQQGDQGFDSGPFRVTESKRRRK